MSIWKKKSPPFIGRTKLADSAFAELLSIDVKHHDLAVSIRRAVAKTCSVEAQMLYPSDSTTTLVEFAMTQRRGWWQDWDDLGLVFALKQELEIELPYEVAGNFPPFMRWRLFWWRGSSPKFLGEWVEQVVAVIRAK